MNAEKEQVKALVERGRRGERDAQESLVRLVQNRVYYHCKKMLKNDQNAQDATQDILITMLTNLDKLREPEAFWGWVNGITANRCRHLLSAPHKEWQIPETEEGESFLDRVENLDEQLVPEEALDDKETRRMILELVDALPPEQRMSVLFYYYDEMSVKEIAQAMEVSEGTVKSRLNYARKAIKGGVEEYERKGVKLYGVSPLVLLVLFLRREAQSTTMGKTTAAAMSERILARVLVGTAAGGPSAGTAGAGKAAAAGRTGAVAGISKKLIALAAVAVIAVGGLIVGVAALINGNNSPGELQSGGVAQGAEDGGEGVVFQTETFAAYAQVNVFDNRVTLVDTAGNLYMWGNWDETQNLLGEPGQEPKLIMEDIRLVRTNRACVAAIRSDGTLYFQKWKSAETTDPVELDDLVGLDVGAFNNSFFYAGIKSDGSLWMWGDNYDHQIYGADEEMVNEPIKVMDDVAQVSCGSYHTLALKTDGTLWAWGGNGMAPLGNGSPEASVEPVLVMEDVAYIDCASEYSAAIKKDGTLWMWGNNWSWLPETWDESGNVISPEIILTPQLVAEDVAKVNCGENTASIIKNDGSLWMWVGRGYEVSAMDGSTGLVKVMDHVVDASTDRYTVAIKTDGTVWIWGEDIEYSLEGNLISGQENYTPTQMEFTIPAENLGSAPWNEGDVSGEQKPAAVDLSGAYAAYLSVLQSHAAQMSGYSSWYETIGEVKPVNFVDIYGDAIPEMIYVETTTPGSSESRLVILSYENGELVTLYENDDWDFYAGSGLSFTLYQSEGSKNLYAYTSTRLQGQYLVTERILFDDTDGQFTANVLKYTGLYYWNGEEIDSIRYKEIEEEFPTDISNAVLSNWMATTDSGVELVYNTSAMTVAGAEAFLSNAAE